MRDDDLLTPVKAWILLEIENQPFARTTFKPTMEHGLRQLTLSVEVSILRRVLPRKPGREFAESLAENFEGLIVGCGSRKGETKTSGELTKNR